MEFIMLRVVLLALLVSPSLGFAASFDCSKATSLPEMTICNDPELSKLDDELSAVYQRAKSRAKDQTAFKQQTRAAWKWRETNCQTKECLVNWYTQRKATLLKTTSASGGAKCLSAGAITIKGFVVSQSITLEPDGRQSTAYLLNIKEPVCVRVEPLDIGEARDVMTNRFQLVSYSDEAMSNKLQQLLFKEVTIGGVLSTDNVTQYYAESNAIDVKSIEPQP